MENSARGLHRMSKNSRGKTRTVHRVDKIGATSATNAEGKHGRRTRCNYETLERSPCYNVSVLTAFVNHKITEEGHTGESTDGSHSVPLFSCHDSRGSTGEARADVLQCVEIVSGFSSVRGICTA